MGSTGWCYPREINIALLWEKSALKSQDLIGSRRRLERKKKNGKEIWRGKLYYPFGLKSIILSGFAKVKAAIRNAIWNSWLPILCSTHLTSLNYNVANMETVMILFWPELDSDED